MSCCISRVDFRRDEINGTCKHCGEYTVNDEAYEQCEYSPVSCHYCNSAPCEGGC